MKIEKENLIYATEIISVSSEHTEEIWNDLNEQSANKYNFSHILYYIPAFLVLMFWFISQAWTSLSGEGIFWIASTYFVVLFIAGNFLWNKKKLMVAGGLFITFAVGMVPIIVYGLQKWTGYWIDNDFGSYQTFYSWLNGRFATEIATLLAGSIAFYFYRFSFLTMFIFLSFWLMVIEITNTFGLKEDIIDAIRSKVGVVLGLVGLAIAYNMDLKNERKLAFWPYFFGIYFFWSGIWELMTYGSESSQLAYLLINFGLICLSVLLHRTIFVVYGTFGVVSYTIVLFYENFEDSINFCLECHGKGPIFAAPCVPSFPLMSSPRLP